jgi:hypothetical protein
MLEDLSKHPFFLNRHRQAPLLKEREAFLRHLQQQGTSRKALLNLAGMLLHVMRVLKLNQMRDVSLEEIRRAARRWTQRQRSIRGRTHTATPPHPLYTPRRNGCDSTGDSRSRLRHECDLPMSSRVSLRT